MWYLINDLCQVYTLQTGVKIEAFIHFVIFMKWMNEQNGCCCNMM